MIPPMSATRAALLGMQASLRKLDQAAEVISRAGLELDVNPPADTNGPADSTDSGLVPATSDDDFLGAMVDMMVAQRAYSAQLRVLEAADDMTREAIDLAGPRG